MTVAEMTQTETATIADAKISQNLVDALNEKFAEQGKKLEIIAGRKFNKIAITLIGQRSVFAFVEIKTGLLYKAAGWKAPAKGFRYDLNTAEEFARVVEIADPYGAFLYVR